MSTVHVASSAQFRTLLSSNSVVVTDFYADWCGPCKAIAPIFEKLSAQHSKPKTVAFAKVNVDSQQDIARQYGVTAMPTFIIFKNGSVSKTLRGADPRGLTSAVEEAVRSAGPAKPVYSSVGRTLGGTPARKQGPQVPWSFEKLIQTIIGFLGLYLVSLVSLDGYASAEASQFNIHRANRPAPIRPANNPNTRTGAATQVGKRLGTIADISGDS